MGLRHAEEMADRGGSVAPPDVRSREGVRRAPVRPPSPSRLGVTTWECLINTVQNRGSSPRRSSRPQSPSHASPRSAPQPTPPPQLLPRSCFSDAPRSEPPRLPARARRTAPAPALPRVDPSRGGEGEAQPKIERRVSFSPKLDAKSGETTGRFAWDREARKEVSISLAGGGESAPSPLEVSSLHPPMQLETPVLLPSVITGAALAGHYPNPHDAGVGPGNASAVPPQIAPHQPPALAQLAPRPAAIVLPAARGTCTQDQDLYSLPSDEEPSSPSSPLPIVATPLVPAAGVAATPVHEGIRERVRRASQRVARRRAASRGGCRGELPLAAQSHERGQARSEEQEPRGLQEETVLADGAGAAAAGAEGGGIGAQRREVHEGERGESGNTESKDGDSSIAAGSVVAGEGCPPPGSPPAPLCFPVTRAPSVEDSKEVLPNTPVAPLENQVSFDKVMSWLEVSKLADGSSGGEDVIEASSGNSAESSTGNETTVERSHPSGVTGTLLVPIGTSLSSEGLSKPLMSGAPLNLRVDGGGWDPRFGQHPLRSASDVISHNNVTELALQRLSASQSHDGAFGLQAARQECATPVSAHRTGLSTMASNNSSPAPWMPHGSHLHHMHPKGPDLQQVNAFSGANFLSADSYGSVSVSECTSPASGSTRGDRRADTHMYFPGEQYSPQSPACVPMPGGGWGWFVPVPVEMVGGRGVPMGPVPEMVSPGPGVASPMSGMASPIPGMASPIPGMMAGMGVVVQGMGMGAGMKIGPWMVPQYVHSGGHLLTSVGEGQWGGEHR